jgi:DNA-binding MarR family transcriptional regulator
MTVRRGRAAPSQLPEITDPHALHDRPGFLIRRAHQISQALFLEESGGITPTQYGVLRILAARPDLDQIGVAKLLGQDRSTTSLVISKLTRDGLVARGDALHDRRRRTLTLTPAGHAVLAALAEPLRQSHDRLLSVFAPGEAEQFLHLLRRFVAAFNAASRTPSEIDPAVGA